MPIKMLTPPNVGTTVLFNFLEFGTSNKCFSFDIRTIGGMVKYVNKKLAVIAAKMINKYSVIKNWFELVKIE